MKIVIPVIVAIIVVVIIIILLNTNKGIELTDENYMQYLKITSSVYGTSDSQYRVYLGIDHSNYVNIASSEEEYRTVRMQSSIEGLSSNYIYEDVEVTIHFYGTLPLRELKSKGVYSGRYKILDPTFAETGEDVTIDKTLTIKCDSSGNSILGSNTYYEENAKENNYFSSEDIKNNIEKDITVKGTVREVK